MDEAKDDDYYYQKEKKAQKVDKNIMIEGKDQNS